uniref:CSON002572 protein n=1 Tax=Culicoides sonorensis TaxID=179676 RepID=A0A336MKV7_CULSO
MFDEKRLIFDNTATLAYSNCLPPADVEKTPSYKRRKIDRKSQSEKTPVKDQSKTSLPVDPYEFTIDETSNPQEQLREPTCTEPVEDKTEDKKKSSKNAFITSKSEYILCDWQKSEAELDADMEPHVRASLEIPSWSIKERNQLVYSIEGTENMTDEIFLKRHAKFETDERRRKKWDVQRLREQKQIERLKKRYLKDEYEDQDHLKLESKTITSFYPSPENIQYIQIVEELPVLAFGEPIPSIPEADFSLPWLTNKDKSNMSPTTCFTKTRFFSKKK